MDDKIKLFVNYLVKEYKYAYYFETSQFGNDLKKLIWPDNPIVLASGKNDLIEVMAFGGCIAVIDCNNFNRFMLNSKKVKSFIKYLGDRENRYKVYYGKAKTTYNEYYLPEKFIKKYLDKDDNFNADSITDDIINNCPTPASFSDDNKDKLQKCLDLLVCAAYVRFMHRSKNEMTDVSERSMQTIIARKNIDIGHKSDFVFIDTEFKIQIKKENEEKTSSVDLVVLDKKRKAFGLIEFKYQGKSMDKDDKNSLTVHCDDFKIMLEKQKDVILEKLKKFTVQLIDLDIITDGKVKQSVNETKELWCGFYFISNKDNNTARNHVTMSLDERIAKDYQDQVIEKFEPKFLEFVKFQHVDIGDMDKGFSFN